MVLFLAIAAFDQAPQWPHRFTHTYWPKERLLKDLQTTKTHYGPNWRPNYGPNSQMYLIHLRRFLRTTYKSKGRKHQEASKRVTSKVRMLIIKALSFILSTPYGRNLIQTKKPCEGTERLRNVRLFFVGPGSHPPPTYTDETAYAVTFFLLGSQPPPTNVQ